MHKSIFYSLLMYSIGQQFWCPNPPVYMATRVIHMVNTGEMVSDAGMLIRPRPSNGMSTLRI